MTFHKLFATGAVCAATLIFSAAHAATVVVDFDSGTANASVGTLSPGVVFSGATYYDNQGLVGSSGALGIGSTTGYSIWSSADPITIAFTSGVSSFSIGILDLGANGFTVEAFDASNHLLGSDSKFGTGIGVGNYDTVSVSAANIASVELFQPQDIIGDGVLLDNMTYTTAAVPEPTTGALLLLGVAALGVVSRRRKA